MQVIFDADGLIKLNRAGVLSHVIGTFACALPQAVYDEVVTSGKARQYQDAEVIEATLAGRAEVTGVEARSTEALGLGAGERAILGFLSQAPRAVVISDDRRFLTVLAANGTPFVTPADMLVVLLQRGILTSGEARRALEPLRPAIRTQAYWDARRDLEA